MKIVIVTVGKPSNNAYIELIREYEKRLSKDISFSWQFIPASKSQDIQECRDTESALILRAIKDTDNVILLDERGKIYNNEQFSSMFAKYAGSHGRFIFIIGGAYGVSDMLRNRSTAIWSFSPLIFPHQLIRIMLIEQLYRTIQMQKSHPYHHI